MTPQEEDLAKARTPIVTVSVVTPAKAPAPVAWYRERPPASRAKMPAQSPMIVEPRTVNAASTVFEMG